MTEGDATDPTTGAQASIATTPASPTGTRPSRRSIAMRALLLIGIVLVVFVGILPRVVDYDAVGQALSGLSTTQLALLVLATLIAYVANAGPTRILIPGLSWPRAVGADLAARAVVSTIPGPTDIPTRFVLYRQWGISADAATAGIIFAAFFETASALGLPVIATLGVVVTGNVTRPSVIWLTVIGVVVLVLAIGLLATLVRSEPMARRFGGWLERVTTRLWEAFHRTPPSGVAQNVMDVRERSKDTLSRHGLAGFGAAVVAKLAWFAVLEVALWSVGITPDVLPPSAVLAAMATVALVALVPITPGAVGVSEVAYIGFLTAVAGEGLTGAITAAVVIFRAAQWLAPIPLGWILLVIMRGRHWRDIEQGNAAAAPAAGSART